MPSVTIQTGVSGDTTGQYSKSFTVSGGSRLSIEEAIDDGSTDLEVAFVLDVSQAKSFCLKADQNMVVETNSGSSPANTFTLEAGKPYIFPVSQGEAWVDTEAGAVDTDITALFVTNASGTDATLSLDTIYDPTV